MIDIPLNLLSFIYEEEYFVIGFILSGVLCLFCVYVIDRPRIFYVLEPRFMELPRLRKSAR